MNVTNAPSHEDLIKQLQELTSGLYYISESDYPLEVVVLDQVADNNLTSAILLTLTNQSAGTPVQEETLPFFFRNMTKERADADEETQNKAERFKLLQNFMEQHLQNIKVYCMGKREIKAYIIGKTADNRYIGFKTTVVQT